MPIDAEDGGVGGVLVVCNDVTSQYLARQALVGQTEHLRQIFNQAPGFIAVLSGADHIFELTNSSYEVRPAIANILEEAYARFFLR